MTGPIESALEIFGINESVGLPSDRQTREILEFTIFVGPKRAASSATQPYNKWRVCEGIV